MYSYVTLIGGNSTKHQIFLEAFIHIWNSIINQSHLPCIDQMVKMLKTHNTQTQALDSYSLPNQNLGQPLRSSQPFHSEFISVTKNMLLTLSKKCHSVRKDIKSRKQWEGQYLKRIGKDSSKMVEKGKSITNDCQIQQKIHPTTTPTERNPKMNKSKKRIEYQNEYLNELMRRREKQQEHTSNKFMSRIKEIESQRRFQSQFVVDNSEDEYIETQLDPDVYTLNNQSQIQKYMLPEEVSQSAQVQPQQQQGEVRYNYEGMAQVKKSKCRHFSNNIASKRKQRKHPISLYDLELSELLTLFISELLSPLYTCVCPNPGLMSKTTVTQKCKCGRPTAVHRAVAADLDVCRQIQQVMTSLKSQLQLGEVSPQTKEQGQYGCNFNEDRFMVLCSTDLVRQDTFAEQIVTPFEHRALAMLLKRIKHVDYSVSISRSTPELSTGLAKFDKAQLNGKNSALIKFYESLYTKSVEEYYEQLLKIQLQFKRYAQTALQIRKMVIGNHSKRAGPTNFVRKLLTAVFQDKIRGQGETKMRLLQLESDINSGIVAEILLNKMRTSSQLGPNSQKPIYQKELNILPKLLFKDQSQSRFSQVREQPTKRQQLEEKKQRYKFDPDLVGELIDDKQKTAIQKTLQRFKRNKKQVPYPKCMFLQYRLRAFRQQSYKNANNPSSDSDQQKSEQSQQGDQIFQNKNSWKMTNQKIKDLHVYKGYRGYKTKFKIAETRKMNKGIAKSVKYYSNQQQFYLPSLEKEPNKKGQEPNKSPSQERDEVKVIPFPFYLSIFSEKMQSEDKKKADQSDKKLEEQKNNKKLIIDLSD